MKFSLAVILSVSAVASARFIPVRRADFTLANGQQALAEEAGFAKLTATSACQTGQNACINGQFAQCANNKFVLTACAPGTVCHSLPLVNSAGTSVTCTTDADFQARIAATGANSAGTAATAATTTAAAAGGNNAGKGAAAATATAAAAGTGDPNTSLTLDPAVIAKAFANNGQDQPTAGQVASLTSTNNFINFCKSSKFPLTTGKQVTTGFCNPAPMGEIGLQTNMPSCKFSFPKNGGEVEEGKSFTIKLTQNNLVSGHFTNAQESYYTAPQQIDAATKNIIGHQHVVIQQMTALDQTTPLDPTKFSFFKGINAPAQNGVLTADVTDGLPAGVYRMTTIVAAANHQPCLVSVAQHGALDDTIYFTVKKGANPAVSFANPAAAAAAPAAAAGTAANATATANAAKAKGAANGKGGKN
ncbi:hypothetical protein BDY19DRAFT_96599 [Irpex rosettiformis]|uniref:Uncharacterized protein n=1 Tax=Irpex rosettiformis TaxID=378272 RepID=A0ACB8U717_9APHY|nr:hypothetical protein BDY19DRAFT_96599 [Irpex rosettiformis]